MTSLKEMSSFFFTKQDLLLRDSSALFPHRFFPSNFSLLFPSYSKPVQLLRGILLESVSDSVLLKELRGGDKKALAQLYGRYRERVLKHCTRLLCDGQAAMDVVQNVFMKLQTEHSSIRNGQSLQSWIFTVARNEAFGELRRRKWTELHEEIVWEGELPDEELSRKNLKETVQSVLNNLYPSFREVIVLREYEQMSYEEIAQVTGLTISAVKSKLFKARKALIQKLQPYLTERAL